MRTEKIITIYATIVKEGLRAHPPMQPDPVIFSRRYPSECSFYLTSFMYFCQGKKYTTELDVTFNGKSVLPESDRDENSMETFMFSPISETHTMVGTALFVKRINLVDSGTYDVTFRMYEEIDGNLGTVIDQKTCTIIAAEPIGASS